jgi:hypothetical protein
VRLLGGAREGAGFGYGAKITKLVKFHGWEAAVREVILRENLV